MEEDRRPEETRSHDTAAERQKRAGMASFRPHARSQGARAAGSKREQALKSRRTARDQEKQAAIEF